MRYENLLEEIGEFGTYQKRICVLTLVATLCHPWFVILPAFTQYKTAFRCRLNHSFYENGTEFEISWEESGREEECGEAELQISNQFRSNGTQLTKYKRPCNSGWEYQDRDTVIAEFNLVCDDSWKPTLALTLFMAGMGFGSVFGSLSDRFGRRPIFLFSVYFQFFMSGVMGFVTNFETYAICMFFLGTSVFVAHNVSVTTMSEMIGSRRHDAMMFLILFAWSAGFCISSLIAFWSRNWRWYLRSCSLIGLIYAFPLWKWFPESLRWQIVSGKINDAQRSISFIAKMNGKVVNAEDVCEKLVNTEVEKNKNLNNDGGYFRTCWKSSSLRNRFIALNICWTVSQLLYFSISLHPITNTNSRFVHVLIVGIAEMPGNVFGYIMAKYFGLTWCCSVSIGLAGIVSLVVPFLYSADPGFLSVATFFGKCFVASSYGYVIMLIAQTTPTMMRSTAIGVASLNGKIGGLIMPYLMLVGDENNSSIPYFIMGSLGCFSAFLLQLLIPDTREHIPDTVKEAEDNRSDYLHVI